MHVKQKNVEFKRRPICEEKSQFLKQLHESINRTTSKSIS